MTLLNFLRLLIMTEITVDKLTENKNTKSTEEDNLFFPSAGQAKAEEESIRKTGVSEKQKSERN
jgi:hypothetical protein